MAEGPPKPERESGAGVDAFERLVNGGVWNADVEGALREIQKTHPEDLYMLYLNYIESGIVSELPEHELGMFRWLEAQFGDEAGEGAT